METNPNKSLAELYQRFTCQADFHRKMNLPIGMNLYLTEAANVRKVMEEQADDVMFELWKHFCKDCANCIKDEHGPRGKCEKLILGEADVRVSSFYSCNSFKEREENVG